MSVAWLTWAYKQRVGDGTAKSVLAVIADHADENGYAYPSIKRIVEYSEFQKRAVYRALEKLEALRLLARRERRRKDGGQAVNDYLLLPYPDAPVIWPDEEQVSRRRPNVKAPADPGALKTPPGVGEAHPPGVLKTPTCNEEPSGKNRNRESGKNTQPSALKSPPTPPRAFDIELHLTDADWEAARALAPGWDVKYLARQCNAHIAAHNIAVRSARAIFLDFIPKHTKGKRP